MWLYDMSSTLGMILDPAFTGDLATASAGSGPYVVKAHNQGESVVLANNTKYWGNPARFDEVTFRYSADPNPQVASMLSGDLDVISNLQSPDALSQFADTTPVHDHHRDHQRRGRAGPQPRQQAAWPSSRCARR